MSYTIEYNRKIYKWRDKYSEDNYILLIREGDNNVRDADTGLRSKEWHFITTGWEYCLWEKIGERSGYCEGGSIQRAKGFEADYISIEDYIALYRKAIKNAKPLNKILEDFNIEVIIELKDGIGLNKYKKNNYQYFELESIQQYKEKYNFKNIGKNYYYKDIKDYIFYIKTLEEFLDLYRIPRGKYGSDYYCYLYFRKI